ncbi:oxidoreductase [Mycobacteroides abscessus subsp. abscessus]|nr:oxidoreductase [Mycobacteroides abscessus subsp. abscessus]
MFVHGCLGGVGRSAVQLASARGAAVAGSCRVGAEREARELEIDPIVEFDFDPTRLKGRFDIVLDTAGTMPVKDARKMLTRNGRTVSVHPSPANVARSAVPGPFRVVIAQTVTADIEAIARDAAEGTLRIPIARTAPLAEAIPALNELEQTAQPSVASSSSCPRSVASTADTDVQR